ncbi:FUSC family protein [Azorhizobium doebereinerae]|uniref:FUSC family protein n=1 Tax=Azorhizobium doebereinerae TaxID=281091 RepID=UPI00041CE8C8|nr:FUSC family protein [Azorhizobium doebereinerae]
MIRSLLTLRPGFGDLFFSLKTFAAAMLALFIALYFGLEKPYWAMGTVYIVSQPLSGALTSKSVYRVIGTGLGAVMAVVSVPALATAPELLSLALALWVGGCLAVSLLDRTPRSYLTMLAGYTAAIIGFSSVSDPSAVFETAVARVEEIVLAITCAGLVGHLVWPRHVGPVIAARVDGWLKDAGALAVEALSGAGGAEARRRRARLAFDATELHGLAVHLAYDHSDLRGTTRQMQALRGRMLLLLPLLATIGERVAALKAEGLPPRLAEVLDRLKAWTAAGESADPAEAAQLRELLDGLKPALGPQAGWDALKLAYLIERIKLFMELKDECRALWLAVRTGRAGMPSGLRASRRVPPPAPVHRDARLAIWSGAAAALAILACCTFWIASAWPEGAGAAQMAAVGASIMAGFDDPVPMLLSFIRGTLIALVVVCIYQFALLPGIDGFPMLAVTLALYMVPAGMLLSMPGWGGTGMALVVNFAVLSGIQERFSADFATFLNGNLAAVAGMGFSAIVIALVRSMTVERAMGRLLAANAADLAAIASGPTEARAEPLAGRMLDRLGLLVPRLAKAGEGAPATGHALREVIAAINVADLKRARMVLPAPARAAIEALLPQVVARAVAVSGDVAAGAYEHAMADLREPLDAALEAVLAAPAGHRRTDAAVALTALRCALMPAAPAFAAQAPQPLIWKEAV